MATIRSNKMVCYSLLAALVLALGGCASSTAKKPEATASSAGGAKPGDQQGAGEGERGGTRESTTPGQSSLDQLREGKSAAAGPLKDVFFDFDRYDLRADARDTLKTNANWLKGNGTARVEIEGHCDERGTNEYNLALGAKRAQAAKDYLMTLGIPAERLSTISYGEEIPVCKEQSESCWGQNRRARFVIVPGRPAS
jgi:peptidoglycan-associated lipoprotein